MRPQVGENCVKDTTKEEDTGLHYQRFECTKKYMSRLIGPVLDSGDDGIVGFDVFLTMEVFRCFREVSSKPHGRFSSSI